MAIGETANSATIGTTEHSLATNTSYGTDDAQTDDGVVQVFLDLNALAAGDQFQFRIYEKVQNSSGTQRVVYEAILTGAQAQPVFASPALTLMHGWDATLDKLAGTDRAIPWSIRRIPVA